MLRKIIPALSLAVALSAATFVSAETIISTVPYASGDIVNAFGTGYTNTYGETFTAPGNSLTSFTFYVDASGTTNVTAQVYAWNGSLYGGNGPQGTVGSALFSQAATINGNGDGTAVTIATGGVPLTVGDNYIILLTNPDSDNAEAWDIDYSHPGVAGDGGFNFNNGPATDPDWTAVGDFGDFGSLVYSATFNGSAATPEPASLTLLGTGVLGLAGMARRRFKR